MKRWHLALALAAILILFGIAGSIDLADAQLLEGFR